MNNNKKNQPEQHVSSPLDELLAETSDQAEKSLLVKAWEKLGVLNQGTPQPLEPSGELKAIFNSVDEEMTETELDLLAAAGAPGMAGVGGAAGPYGSAAAITPPASAPYCDIHERPANTTTDNYLEDAFLQGHGSSDLLQEESGSSTSADIEASELGDVYVFSGEDCEVVIESFNVEADRLVFLDGDTDTVTATARDGNTEIRFEATTITIKGLELTLDDILALSDLGAGQP